MRELYLECYSGISGDMSVAALLDVGADKEYLLKTLATMPLTGYEVKMCIRDRFQELWQAVHFHLKETVG